MTTRKGLGFEQYFETLEDPRIGPMHRLLDMVGIALCAVLSGAEDWGSVVEFGRMRESWFRRYFELPHGIPSHDTFARVFSQLDAEQFEASFRQWVGALSETMSGEVIAVDGKTVRRSHDHLLGRKAIHMVSAWAANQHLVLGQVQVDEKSNEITAIPKLLRLLNISGCIVTIDAMGCQKEIARQIVAQGGDYVLALKENQDNMYQRVQTLFAFAQNAQGKHVKQDRNRVVEKGHGRLEERICTGIAIDEWEFYLDGLAKWSNLRTIIMVERYCQKGETTTRETRFFLSSLPCAATLLQQAVRQHWAIENSLHWVLDIAFREDECRLRKGYGAHNFSILRRLALNLLRQNQSVRLGIKNKRLRAGWNPDYLLDILAS